MFEHVRILQNVERDGLAWYARDVLADIETIRSRGVGDAEVYTKTIEEGLLEHVSSYALSIARKEAMIGKRVKLREGQ